MKVNDVAELTVLRGNALMIMREVKSVSDITRMMRRIIHFAVTVGRRIVEEVERITLT